MTQAAIAAAGTIRLSVYRQPERQSLAPEQPGAFVNAVTVVVCGNLYD